MATGLSIQIHLPDDLYERIRDTAARHDQPIETVLVDSLALLFGTAPVDWDHLAATLEALSDAQLWALVYRRLAWASASRLRELTARSKQALLSPEEESEIAALIDEADRLTVLRSRALLVLQARGQPVRDYLQLGA